MLNRMFKRRPYCVLGLDITDNCIKAVAVSCIKQELWVEQIDQIELPPFAVIAQEIKDSNVVSKVLRQIIKNINLPIQFAVAALPYHSVIAKYISFKRADLIDLETEIIITACKELSYPADELTLDYQIIEENSNSQVLEIYYLAARKKTVLTFKNVFESADISLRILDVDVYVLMNVLPTKEENYVSAIFCIDESRLLIVVAKNTQMLFAYSEVIHPSTNSEKEQEKKDVIIELINQIKRSWQFYLTAANYQPIMKAFLIGDFAYSANLHELISNFIAVPVVLLNDYLPTLFRKSAVEEIFRKQASSWYLPLQLALRGWQQ